MATWTGGRFGKVALAAASALFGRLRRRLRPGLKAAGSASFSLTRVLLGACVHNVSELAGTAGRADPARSRTGQGMTTFPEHFYCRRRPCEEEYRYRPASFDVLRSPSGGFRCRRLTPIRQPSLTLMMSNLATTKGAHDEQPPWGSTTTKHAPAVRGCSSGAGAAAS